MLGEIEGKGLETVRRDNFPLVQNTVSKVIEILFREKDLSKIKIYLNDVWSKLNG